MQRYGGYVRYKFGHRGRGRLLHCALVRRTMHLRLRKVRRTGRRGGGRSSLHWRFYVVCPVKKWLARIGERLNMNQRTIPWVSI
jgi:hypothetical protein